jgi:protocatechuate 3,4-dioxygenase beta subunit
VEENLNRSDIRTDPSDGSIRPGVLLNLKVNVVNESGTTCVPLAGARVDIWHCDAGGTYSDEAANNSSGKKFLRGYQTTDDTGAVNFTTIYPGWYSGRTVHIHFRIRTYSGSTKLDEFVAQIFFDDTLTDTVFTNAPYNTRPNRDTRNSNDMVLTGSRNGSIVYADVTRTETGYAATAIIGVTMKTPTAAAPAITQAGVVNGASFKDGIAAGSWVAIFGQNLAAGTRALTSDDLVNGSMPASLGGVGVSINNKPAFLYYVSPTQVNVLAPDDASTGAVSVSVTNSAGTSSAASATLLSAPPRCSPRTAMPPRCDRMASWWTARR